MFNLGSHSITDLVLVDYHHLLKESSVDQINNRTKAICGCGDVYEFTQGRHSITYEIFGSVDPMTICPVCLLWWKEVHK